jgi:aerobic-type carbon monoxide dehydrogenase small subunit (CoxS/CutS family)
VNTVDIGCAVNGRDLELTVPVRTTAAELLRDRLGLHGTKVSCELQVCGVCTILVDGEPVSSCSMLAADLDGRRVDTVEGLQHGGELHPLQDAFWRHNAFQCGFCTPGFLMMAKALLDEVPDPSPAQVREWLDGNLCRCTGYRPIEAAILAASSPTDGEPQ